jgi:hypothetical protein
MAETLEQRLDSFLVLKARMIGTDGDFHLDSIRASHGYPDRASL